MSSKKTVKITRNIKQGINSVFGSRRDAEIILANLPAEVNVDENDKWVSKPVVKNEKHIVNTIVEPLAKTIVDINDELKIAKPQYIVDFDYKPQSTQPPEQPNPKEEKQTNYTVEKPRFPLSRVVLPESTKTGIEIVMSLVKHDKLMYETWNLASIEGSARHSVTINLYGSSGTGKTLCAEAIAYELNKEIMPVKYPQLESSLVGETNKNIQEVFRFAKEQNCVLFFDEADSILGKRLSSVTQSADHGINMARSVMLIELEKFEGVVIFATNFVENYDMAFARRLLHFVKFDMPDEQARKRLFQVHLPKELPLENGIELDELAKLTERFSGGDICNVVLKSAAKAANQDIADDKKIVTKQHFIDSINEISESKKLISQNNLAAKIVKKLPPNEDSEE